MQWVLGNCSAPSPTSASEAAAYFVLYNLFNGLFRASHSYISLRDLF